MEDTKRLTVIAGAGGNGSVSFLREKLDRTEDLMVAMVAMVGLLFLEVGRT